MRTKHEPTPTSARAMGTAAAVAVVSLLTAGLAPAGAEISRKDRKAAEKMFPDSVFLRVDAPCTKGRHPYGVYYSPLVEVSPQGSNLESSEGGAEFGWFHAQSTVWAARVNDEMELDELDWDEDESSVEVELEGTGRSDGKHTVIRFVGIRSLADFEAAFEHAFSHRPLEEEHPDWSAEVRRAIAERRLVAGMTKRQAYYVVGRPARVAKSEEDGKTVEVWTLQRQGMEIGFWGMKTGDPGAAPESIRFEDGSLVTADVATGAGALDLDD